jgi:hypothetical protein
MATGGSGDAGGGGTATSTAISSSGQATANATATGGIGTPGLSGTAGALATANGISVLQAAGPGGTASANVSSGPHGTSISTSSITNGITLSGTLNLDTAGPTFSPTGLLTVGQLTNGVALQFLPDTGGETLNSLTIDSGSTLDISNNHIIFTDPGGSAHDSTYVSILDYVKNGSIISSTGYSGYGVGLVDGNDAVSGTPVSANSIEVAYTLEGDANLDGKVDATDFSIFAPHFGLLTSLGWEAGDFNYDGRVDASDFSAFASNFGLSDTGTDFSLPAADWTALDSFAAANGLLVNVPEPASGSLILVAVGIFARRRHRRSRSSG